MKKLILIASLALAGCSTQTQRALITVGCAADTLVPVAAATANAVAVIANPADVELVAAASAADRPVHAVVQQACADALAGSKPIPGTVNPITVPVAAPVSKTTAIIVPVTQ